MNRCTYFGEILHAHVSRQLLLNFKVKGQGHGSFFCVFLCA